MRAREFVTEAFDRPYAMTWEHGDESHDALVRLPDGGTLSIMFSLEHPYNSDAEEWHVEFYRNFSQEITGEGDQQRIFATVLEAIREFVAIEHPEHIRFSANKDVEPGQKAQTRTNLYNRLVQRYASSLGYQTEISDFGGSTVYNLFKLYEGVAETVNHDMVKKGWHDEKTITVPDVGELKLVGKNISHIHPPQFMVDVFTPEGKNVGYFRFLILDYEEPKKNFFGRVKPPKKDAYVIGGNVSVSKDYQRKGIARQVYQWVQSLGNDIQPSTTQTAAGKAMWQSFNRQGMAEEEQLDELSFLGSECTKDCSGHRAGYEWSKRKGLRQANSWSPSFNKGAGLAVAGK